MNQQGELAFKQYLTDQIDWMATKKQELDINIQYNSYTEIQIREMALKKVLAVFESVQEFK